MQSKKDIDNAQEQYETKSIDKELRKIAHQHEIQVPTDYEEKLDKLLAGLQQGESARVIPFYKRMRRPVAVAIGVVLGVGTIATSATMLFYRSRMEDIPETERALYNEIIQNAEIYADSYSRELSEEELQRKNNLQDSYTEDGIFPESSLRIIDSVDEWTGEEIAYHTPAGMFYLPERELSDEELLELVDFQYKCAYSVDKLNDKSEETEQLLVNEKMDKEVYDKVVMAADMLLEKDISDSYYTTEVVENEKEFLYTFYQDNQRSCIVTVDTETYDVLNLLAVSDTVPKNIEFFRDDVTEGYEKLQEGIEAIGYTSSQISHATAEYYLKKDGITLWNGEIRYLLEFADGTCYIGHFDCREQRMITVSKLSEQSETEQWNAVDDEAQGRKQLVRKLQKLK